MRKKNSSQLLATYVSTGNFSSLSALISREISKQLHGF